MRVADESADRFTNLFFAHAYESIDEFLNMLEVAFADTLRAQPVGDGARRLLRREGDAPASFEAGSGLGSELGFNTVNFYFGSLQFDCGRDSADHAPTTDTDQHIGHIGKIFEDLEPHSALSGDDGFVVIGWNQSITVLGGKCFSALLAFVARRRSEEHTSELQSRM